MYCTRSILLYMIVIVNCEWFCVLWLWRMIAIAGDAGKRMSGSVFGARDRQSQKQSNCANPRHEVIKCPLIQWPDILTPDCSSWHKYFTHHILSLKCLVSSSLVLLDKTLVDDVLGCRSWLVCQHVPRAGGGSLGSLGRPGLARHAGARPSHPGWRAEISPPRRTGHFVADFLDKESLRIYLFIRFCIHPFTTNLL